MLQYRLLDGVDIAPLEQAVYGILEKVGILCQNRELMAALEAFGARVDYGAERVRFPALLVQEFVGRVRLADAPESERASAFTPPSPPCFGTQVAQVYYDYATGARRGGNRQDLITCLKLGEALHGDRGVGHCLCLTEVPARLESLESALLLAEYCQHPHPPFAWYVEQVDYLLEMGEIMGWKNWFSYGATCFAHPLRFDRDVADKFVRRVREGGVAGITAMPVAGMTTPVTVEGFAAVVTAEIVATWMAGRALNPACPLGGSVWSATLDMSSGETSYSSPDALYYGFVCCEFIRRWTGYRLPVGGGDYCAAKEPGMYAAMEKAWKAMTIAAFQGRHPSVGEGMLECGRTLCPVQLVIERDLALGHRQLAGKPSTTPERINLPGAIEVDLGFSQNHLASEHTLGHFRELWTPSFIDRRGWTGAAGDRELLNKAQGQINERLAAYRKPSGREDQLARLRAVVERARRNLVR